MVHSTHSGGAHPKHIFRHSSQLSDFLSIRWIIKFMLEQFDKGHVGGQVPPSWNHTTVALFSALQLASWWTVQPVVAPKHPPGWKNSEHCNKKPPCWAAFFEYLSGCEICELVHVSTRWKHAGNNCSTSDVLSGWVEGHRNRCTRKQKHSKWAGVHARLKVNPGWLPLSSLFL